MKVPRKAKLLINDNREYEVDQVHFKTGQITLKESDKVYNTVSVYNVAFNYDEFSAFEIRMFENAFEN